MNSPKNQFTKEEVFRRTNRRRMAWVCLWTMILTVFLLMFKVSETKIEALEAIIDMYLFCLSSIILGYLGVSSLDYFNNVKNFKNAKQLHKEDNDEETEEEEPTPKKK